MLRQEGLMAGVSWVKPNSPTMQWVKYFEGGPMGIVRETNPLRSVYNPRTRQYEEIPLTQFQQLLRQGKIEESDSQSPYDGHPQRVYRLL
jgi:hypothetical protein